ncbi:MAG TPA: nucleotidyltransferase domain-containing protein [Bacillota bacterium]|nr:nucleotidyltransferase domain-containing protein [Bacillota bacterium]
MDETRLRYVDHERREALRLDLAIAERRRRVQRAIVAMVDILKSEPSVRKLIVFGSAARAEAIEPGDIDLAVEGLRSERYLAVWLRLETVAEGISFDLVDLADASEALRRRVLEDGVVLFERA